MSWYKKAQKIIENPENINYWDIGHSPPIEHSREILESNNILWFFNNGTIETKIERDNTSHFQTFDDLSRHYYGRYEAETGKLTIIIPEGVNSFRPIPNILIKKLNERFPNISEIYKYY
jgi:hypothetical protein